MWAVTGQDKFRPLWHHCCQEANGLIFVVVISDPDGVQESRVEFKKMMNEEDIRDAVVLACSNALTTLHGNSFEKDNDRRVQDWDPLWW